MVSSTPALPVVPSNSGNGDNASSGSPETGREIEPTQSFAARLEQRRSQSEPRKEARASQTHRPDTRSDVKETESRDNASHVSENLASATHPGDAAKNTNEDVQNDDKTASAAPKSTPASPLTPDALNSPAFLAALALAQTVASVPVTVPVLPDANLSGTNLPDTNGNTELLSVLAKTASETKTTSPIIPTVAMDSSAVSNTSPGVDNTASLASTLLSAAGIASLPANANAAPTVTLDVSGGANLSNGGAPNANIVSSQAAETAARNSSAAVIAATNLDRANKAAATANNSQATGISPSNILSVANAATSPNGNAPLQNTPVVETLGAGGEASSEVELQNAAGIASGKQNLSGIERLLTLNNAKTASTVSTVVQAIANPAEAKPEALRNAANPATALQENNAAHPGTSAPIAGTASDHPTLPVVLASAVSANQIKTSVASQGGHSLPSALELNHPISSSAPNSGSAIGTVGENGLVSFPQTSAHAEGGLEEQGQDSSQRSPKEQASVAETQSANQAGSGTSSSFAVTRNSENAPVAQTASTANSTQVERAHVVEQVTRHLETMRLTNAGGEMRLRLNPQNLGSVQVTVTAHQDGVVARIAVETAQVQQAMEGAKEHLRAGLEARGLRVQSVDVTVVPNVLSDNTAAFSGQRNWQSASSQDTAQGQPSYGRRTSASVGPIAAAAPIAAMTRPALSDSRLDRLA